MTIPLEKSDSKQKSEKKNSIASPRDISELVSYVYHKCLFDVPQGDSYGAKCKSHASRKLSYSLLLAIARTSKVGRRKVFSSVYKDEMWQHNRSRDGSKMDWRYHPSSLEKFPAKFVGLKNQGATCYMNAIFQQLFMVPEFRKDIMEARMMDVKEEEEKHDRKSQSFDVDRPLTPKPNPILHELQVLFGYLEVSQKKFYDTIPVCKALCTFDGQPINMSEQQDVNEFWTRLVSQLEKDLSKTKTVKKPNVVQRYFGGTVVNQLIPQNENAKIVEREEPFDMLSVTIQNKAHLQQSMELFVEGEIMDGDNKYFCEELDKKIVVLKRACLDKLPDILLIHLQRFEFNFTTMRKVKVNDRFEFPFDLNLEPYTKDGLAFREEAAKSPVISGLKTKDEAMDDLDLGDSLMRSEQSLTSAQRLKLLENTHYKLTGVVVHTGTADGGHYYSYAKTPDNEWYEFNDDKVRPFDVHNMADACFGGEYTHGSLKGRMKPHSAYLLVYRRDNSGENCSKPTTGVGTELPVEINKSIWQENMDFLRDKSVFNFDFQTFLWSLTRLNKSENKPVHVHEIQIATVYTFEILARSKHNASFPQWVAFLKQSYATNPEARTWLFQKIWDDSQVGSLWFKNILFICPHSQVRQAFIDILVLCISYQNEKDGYFDYLEDDKTPQTSVIKLISSSLYRHFQTLREHEFRYQQYFNLIKAFAHMGKEEKKFLIGWGMIKSIVKLYTEEVRIVDKGGRGKQYRQVHQYPHNSETLISLLSLLVRSCTTDSYQSYDDSQPPYALPDLVHLMDEDHDALFAGLKGSAGNGNKPGFFERLFEDKNGGHDDSTVEIVCYWAFGNKNISDIFISQAFSRVEKEMHEAAHNYKLQFRLLRELFQMKDEFRDERLRRWLPKIQSIVGKALKNRDRHYELLYTISTLLINMGLTQPLLMNKTSDSRNGSIRDNSPPVQPPLWKLYLKTISRFSDISMM